MRDINAGDEQQKADATHKHKQRGPELLSRRRDTFASREQLNAYAVAGRTFVGGYRSFSEDLLQGYIDFRLRPSQGHTPLGSPNHQQPPCVI